MKKVRWHVQGSLEKKACGGKGNIGYSSNTIYDECVFELPCLGQRQPLR